MDPTEALKLLLEQAKEVPESQDESDAAQELASQILDLDHWLSRGGFLPSQWQCDQRKLPH